MQFVRGMQIFTLIIVLIAFNLNSVAAGLRCVDLFAADLKIPLIERLENGQTGSSDWLDQLSAHPEFASYLAKPAGVPEGHSVRQHILLSLDSLEKSYLAHGFSYPFEVGLNLRLKPVLKMAIVLKNRSQAQLSEGLLLQILRANQFTNSEIRLAMALAQSPLIESFIYNRIGPKEIKLQLQHMAQVLGIDLPVFASLQMLIYVADMKASKTNAEKWLWFDTFKSFPLDVAKKKKFEILWEEISDKPKHYPPVQIETEQQLVTHLRKHAQDAIEKERLQQFQSALKKASSRDPILAYLIKLFQSKSVTFAIDRSAKARKGLLAQKKFLNIHQAESSGGAKRPYDRARVEGEYLGMNINDYLKVPDDMKPKSMYLIPELNTGLSFDPLVYSQDRKTLESTGDTWVFDYSQIQEQTFFTVGDSLNRALLGRGLTEDIQETTIRQNDHFTKDDLQDYLLPLDMLFTSIPYFYSEVKANKKFRFVDSEGAEYLKNYEDFREEMDGHLADWQARMVLDSKPPGFSGHFFEIFPELKEFQEFFFKPFENYVEGLYFGSLPIEGKVKALIFRGEPPTAAEMEEFKRMNIQVIDGRKPKS